MKGFILAVLFVSVFGLFIENWIVFRNLKTQLHAYLQLSCIAILVNTTGSLLKLMADTEEAYITALQMSYLGRVWITFALFMFSVELCHVKMPAILPRILVVIHTAIFGVILTLRHNSLYYTETEFRTDGMFPVLLHGNGIVHYFFMQLQILYILFVIYWIFSSLGREKRASARKRLWIVGCAFLTESLFFIVQIFHLNEITYIIDVSMLGTVIGTVFMLVAIIKYNLLGIIDIAQEFVLDRLSEGVIAVDDQGVVQYYNEPATHICPGLKNDPQRVLEEVKNAVVREETITVNDRIYSPEEIELKEEGEYFGKLYALVDATELKQNELKLKADAAILEMAAESMKERLMTTEELMQQDRAMRHDRRHFEALLMSLLRDGKTEEVERCLEERLSLEPRTAARFCENTTVNAAITHYAAVAERKSIDVRASVNIPCDPGVDDMQLAIAISNLLENAIHACEKLPEDERYIEITAKYKEQLLLEIVNPCEGRVPLDEEGHPYSTEWDHGIGTRSVLAFSEQTDSEIRYIAEENVFKVRMII